MRDVDAGQRAAMIKRIPTNFFDPVAHAHTGQLTTFIERIVSNGCDRVAYRTALQATAVGEC